MKIYVDYNELFTPVQGDRLEALELTVEEVMEFQEAYLIPWSESVEDLRSRCERFPFTRDSLQNALFEDWWDSPYEAVMEEVALNKWRRVRDPHTIRFAAKNGCLYVREEYGAEIYHMRRVDLVEPDMSLEFN